MPGGCSELCLLLTQSTKLESAAMPYSATIAPDTLKTKLSIITSCLLEQMPWLLGISHFCTLLPDQGLALNFTFFLPVEPEADKTCQIMVITDHSVAPAAYKTFHAFSLSESVIRGAVKIEYFI